MLFGLPLTIVEILLPLIGVIALMIPKKHETDNMKNVSLSVTSVNFILALIGYYIFKTSPTNEYIKDVVIGNSGRFNIYLGIDSFASIMVITVTFVCFLTVLWSARSKILEFRIHFVSLLIFEALSVGAFYSQNIFILFSFVEATILPMYIMMLGRSRFYGEPIFKYLIYTLVSSLIILISIIMIFNNTGAFLVSDIWHKGVTDKFALLLLLLGVAIKLPVWPFYHWLPVVHGGSSTVCSILLASVILKFPAIYLVRFLDALRHCIFQNYIYIISAVLALSICFAVVQLYYENNLKKKISYFSVIHLNLYFFLLLSEGGQSYFVYSISSHSAVMALMFFVCDLLYSSFKTYDVDSIKNMNTKLFNYKALFLFSVCSLISVPFTCGFIGEVASIMSIVMLSNIFTIIIAMCLVCAACHIIRTYYLMFCHDINTDNACCLIKLDLYKVFVLFLIIGIIILLGIYPGWIII